MNTNEECRKQPRITRIAVVSAACRAVALCVGLVPSGWGPSINCAEDSARYSAAMLIPNAAHLRLWSAAIPQLQDRF